MLSYSLDNGVSTLCSVCGTIIMGTRNCDDVMEKSNGADSLVGYVVGEESRHGLDINEVVASGVLIGLIRFHGWRGFFGEEVGEHRKW